MANSFGDINNYTYTGSGPKDYYRDFNNNVTHSFTEFKRMMLSYYGMAFDQKFFVFRDYDSSLEYHVSEFLNVKTPPQRKRTPRNDYQKKSSAYRSKKPKDKLKLLLIEESN